MSRYPQTLPPLLSMLVRTQRAGSSAWMEPFFARPIDPAGATFNIDLGGEGSEETAARTIEMEHFFAHTGPQKTCFKMSPMPTGGQRRGQCFHAGAPHAQTELRPMHPNWGVARAAWGQASTTLSRSSGRYFQTGAATFSFDIHSHKMRITAMD